MQNIIPSLDYLTQFVAIALIIIISVRFLKWKGIFNDSHQPVFDKLVTELVVPVVVFTSLLYSDFSEDTLITAGILFIILLISFVLSYGVGWLLHLPPKVTGTLMMISAFGSTAAMGRPFLVYISTNVHDTGINLVDLANQGISISNYGVVLPLFIIGVLIASYFGKKEEGKEFVFSETLKNFLATPIFFSFLLGVVVGGVFSYLHLPGGNVYSDFFIDLFLIILFSFDLFLWFAIGLVLKPIRISTFLFFLSVVVLIKMVLQPLLAVFFAGMASLPPPSHDLLLLESSIPSGAFAAVFSSRYGCDGSLAGWMVIGTYIISLVSIPIFFQIFSI